MLLCQDPMYAIVYRGQEDIPAWGGEGREGEATNLENIAQQGLAAALAEQLDRVGSWG